MGDQRLLDAGPRLPDVLVRSDQVEPPFPLLVAHHDVDGAEEVPDRAGEAVQVDIFKG